MLPDNWDDFSIEDRRYYFNKEFDTYHTPKEPFGPAIYQREEVSPMEIFCECFNKDKGDFDGKEGRAIAAILMQIEGWDKTDKRKTMGPYGKQTVYIRKKK